MLKKIFLKFFKRKFFALIFLFLSLLVIAVEFFSFAADFDQMVFQDGYSSFSRKHLFGTNMIGQDILKRGLVALSESFQSAFCITTLSLVLAFFFGGLAGLSTRGKVKKLVVFKAFSKHQSGHEYARESLRTSEPDHPGGGIVGG